MEFSGSSTAGSFPERTRIHEHLLPGQDLLFVGRELGPRQLRHLIGRCQLEPATSGSTSSSSKSNAARATLDANLPEVREQSLQKANS